LVEPIEAIDSRLNQCARLLPDLPEHSWRMDPVNLARLAGSVGTLADRLVFLKTIFPGCDVERMVLMTRLKLALQVGWAKACYASGAL